MSDDRTQVYRRPPEEPSGGPSPAVLATAALLVLVLLVLLVVVWMRDRPDPLVRPPESSPTPEITPTLDETPSPTPTPTPTLTPTPTPTPAETPEDREPTDSDAASFAANYRPPDATDVESITADVTGDGRNEVVFVSLADGNTRVDVARWTGRFYEAVFADRGGEAEQIERFTVHDYTATGTREIVTVQSAAGGHESLSIWGWDGEIFTRQRAVGGCWAGSHNYGAIGAQITAGEIRATCEGAPLPRTAWQTDVYVWDGQAWTYDHTDV